MKNLTIKASTPDYAGALQETAFILGAPALLNTGYADLIEGLSLSGGGGGVTVTKENINQIDSFETVDNMLGNTNGNFSLVNNLVSNLVTTETDVYKLRVGDTSNTSTDASPPEFPAPDYDKHISTGDNAINEIESFSSNNSILRSNALPTVTDSVVYNLNSLSTEVVTDVTASGGTSNLNTVEYTINGNDVLIDGDGYKRFLNDLYSKKETIKKIRVTVAGTDADFTPADVFGLTSEFVILDGTKKLSKPFTLLDYFSPRTVQPNIVDFYPNIVLNQNIAIIFKGYFSPDVEYIFTLWY